MQIGSDDPLQPINLDVVLEDPLTVSPNLLLPGWSLQPAHVYVSEITLMCDLTRPTANGVLIRRWRVV